jgi:hypothetical protein
MIVRALVILLLAVDVLIALGCPPLLVIGLAYVRLEGAALALVTLVLVACWLVVPWGALIVAWRQRRRGASHGRIALTLLIPIVTALIAQGLLERLPTRGV